MTFIIWKWLIIGDDPQWELVRANKPLQDKIDFQNIRDKLHKGPDKWDMKINTGKTQSCESTFLQHNLKDLHNTKMFLW